MIRFSIILSSFLALACQSFVSRPPQPEPRLVAVTGTASVRKAPDIIYVEIMSFAESTDPRAAFESALKTSDTTVAHLRNSYNLATEDVAVGSLSISPAYKTIKGERTDIIEKYKAQLLLHLSIRNFADAPKIISDVLKLGIGSVQSFRYDIDRRSDIVRAAQVLAFEDARAKALALAKAAGFRSVSLITIEIDNSRAHFSLNDSVQGYTARNFESFQMAKETLDVEAQVTCRFEMLP